MLNEEILIKNLLREKLTFPLKFLLWNRTHLSNEVLVKLEYVFLEDLKWRLESGSIAIRTKVEDALLKDHKRKTDKNLLIVNEEGEDLEEDFYINKYKKVHAIIYEYIKMISKVVLSNTAIF